MAVSKRVMQAVIDDFNRTRAAAKRAEEAEIRVRELDSVIRDAGQGLMVNGRREPHHYRRQQATLDECTRRLLVHEEDFRRSKDFEDVYHWVDKVLDGVTGVRDLYRYDVAMWIATKLGLPPKKYVYLHSGAAEGATHFGIPKSRKTILPSELPEPLSGVSADDLEDMLCIYKDCFRGNRLPDVRDDACLPSREEKDQVEELAANCELDVNNGPGRP